MRHLGKIDSLSEAEAFVAFLLVQGIDCNLDETDVGIEIWVKDEDRLKTAQAAFEDFRQNSADPKYRQCIPAAQKMVQEKDERIKAIKKRHIQVKRNHFKQNPPLTLILTVLCVLVAFATNFGSNATPRDHTIYRALQFTSVGPPASEQFVASIKQPEDVDNFGFRAASLLRGEVWRLITPIFIHWGLTHIAFNMFMFFSFASLLERRYSSGRLAFLIIVTAAISNFVQCTVPLAWGGAQPYYFPESKYFLTTLGGMSGVLYGLFGYVWIKSSLDPKFGYRIPESTIFIMIAWLVACIFSEQLHAAGIRIIPLNVANWAHAVGLGVGLLLGYLQSPES